MKKSILKSASLKWIIYITVFIAFGSFTVYRACKKTSIRDCSFKQNRCKIVKLRSEILKKNLSNYKQFYEPKENIGKHYMNSAFGLYLTLDVAGYGPHNLDELIRIGCVPVISDVDIEDYNWASHIITITKDSGYRLSNILNDSLDSGGLPFVVLADDIRCYIGAFWREDSSQTFFNPVFFLDDSENFKIITKPRISVNEACITNPERNIDRRKDERVKRCLYKLGKLTDSKKQ